MDPAERADAAASPAIQMPEELTAAMDAHATRIRELLVDDVRFEIASMIAGVIRGRTDLPPIEPTDRVRALRGNLDTEAAAYDAGAKTLSELRAAIRALEQALNLETAVARRQRRTGK